MPYTYHLFLKNKYHRVLSTFLFPRRFA